MTDAEFRMFSRLVRRQCGLHFGDQARVVLEKRVQRRLEVLELDGFAAYHYRLRQAGGGEMARLVDELTTNETYFLRERRQLEALVREILPAARERRLAQGGGPVSVWSAGCASGEEPYSLVILALEAGLVPGSDFHVYASDISRRVLEKARRGAYRESSFRETEPALRQKYFSEAQGSSLISSEVKKHVDFTLLNLVEPSATALLGSMDVILCRNVIIYFDTECKRRVIETFHERLRPGGHLLLGHSESLIDLSNAFELQHVGGDAVYRKPLPGMAPRDALHTFAAATAPETGEPELGR